MQFVSQPTSLSLSLFFPFLLFLLLLTSSHCHGVDVQRLCQARCYYGKGGNLCNCNAFHFAGKRSNGGEETLQLGARPLLQLTVRDMEDSNPGSAPDVLATSSSLAAPRLVSGALGDQGGERRRLVLEGLFGDDAVRGTRAAVNRLTSLIKSALDERLIDRYDATRKRKSAAALPYEEADFVY